MVQLTIIYGGAPLFKSKHTPLVNALPFKDEKRAVPFEVYAEVDEEQEDESLETEEDQVADHGAMRISTRARMAYNLEGYNKNAMLIIKTKVDIATAFEERITEKIAAIAETFQKFRFEIETYIDLTSEEIDAKCHEYFQRDFTDYGCVAVVMMTLEGVKFRDSTVVRHWTTDGNPTLQHKPKFYINEACHIFTAWRSNRPCYEPPITENYSDVLCLHLPAIFDTESLRQPFQVFCDKLTNMADLHDIMTIIMVTMQEMKPLFRSMIYVASTLEKNMFLARNRSVSS